jgi:hypothetical protein
MTQKEKDRLLDFLRKKMCGPCRTGAVHPTHPGCAEAATLVSIVSRETPTG